MQERKFLRLKIFTWSTPNTVWFYTKPSEPKIILTFNSLYLATTGSTPSCNKEDDSSHRYQVPPESC